MIQRPTTKIRRSVVGQSASQVGHGRSSQQQSGLVNSQLKKRRISKYQFNQFDGANNNDDDLI